jgi:hypothetical protein
MPFMTMQAASHPGQRRRGQGAAETMKKILALLLLAGAALGSPVQAATHVSRCTTDGGTAVYTDGSCRSVGGRPVPMSANLLRSLAREGALGGDTNFRPTGTPPRAGGSDSLDERHQLGDATCPRTPSELASRLRTSLGGDGQVNRLASLYDWKGKSSREARPILARLEQLSSRPLIDGAYFGGGGDGDNGTVQLVQGAAGAPTVTEIPVNRVSGCLLLAL